jgi:Holliday junction resolvasome RuvABC endonuclease subunit
MRVLGIDPGVHAGAAMIEIADGAAPQLVDAIDIPTCGSNAKERVDVLALRFQTHHPDRAGIERAQAMPRQGASSGFKYGRAAGALEAVLACCEVPFEIVEPSVWKKTHRLRGGPENKEAARALALQFFPGAHSLLARKRDHGRAEAALIALTVSGRT